jgi:protein-S-isoprenylcysteine O-methyltransferase Ste14
MSPFQIIFLAAWLAEETIRFPHRRRYRQELRQHGAAHSRMTALGVTLDILAFLGMEIVPLFAILSPWLDFADFKMPTALGWLGAVLMAGSIILLMVAHRHLGRNWSPSVDLRQEHKLVTQGIYAYLRHPIYASVWLWCLAQALLVHNWIGGLAGLVLFLPVYLTRLPVEERMMLDAFGDEYRSYMRRTGAIFPKLRRK